MTHFPWQRTGFTLGLVEKYGLFDAGWYCAAHPNLSLTRDTAHAHFKSAGLKQGLSPTPLFQPRMYLARNPDIAAAGMNPLYHYLRHGGHEQRSGAHYLISPEWISQQVDLGSVENANPLIALTTAKQWVNPRPIVDTHYLAAQIGAEASTTWQALRLYASAAVPDIYRPHPLFDPETVRASAPVPKGQSALEFYVSAENTGQIRAHPLIDNDQVFVSGRISLPLPDGTTSYLEEVIKLGAAFRESVGALFDTGYYLRQVESAAPIDCLALEHFLREGWRQGYWPNPWFDPTAYARRYLRAAPGQDPLTHYAKNGREPHIDLLPQFGQRYYTSNYPEVLRDSPYTPLEHYIRHGVSENRQHKPVAAWRDDFSAWSELQDAILSGFSASSGSPLVSVIIPVYGQFEYTLRCLWSILQAGDGARIEVIVADDGSDDETEAFFSQVPGLRYLRNPENLGFLRSCNRAAAQAHAPVLYFLNNDTAVLPGWIDTVLATLETHPEAGLVGSKLIYPDGLLQEAGGYIWQNGGGANAGRGGDPTDPGYNYLRDVDYVSGAAIAVRRTAWEAVGGFDDRYAPAYCEDSDLAMALRQHGWRVLYQPGSEVVHFEGVSSGTDTGAGIKAYQVTNQKQLRAKWAFTLERHAEAHLPDPRALVRPHRPRICVIDARVPTPDKDAGSVTAIWYLRILLDLGYDITYLPENLYLYGDYGRTLQRMGIEVLHAPQVTSLERYLQGHGAAFDCFLLYRVDAGGRFSARIQALYPDTPVIFDTVDLHYLRLERQARLPGATPDAMAQADAVKKRELAVMRTTSATIVLSEREVEILAVEGLRAPVSVIPLVLEARSGADVPGFEGREGIAFVGGYEHTPNVDAVLWFVAEIWPDLHASEPDLTFHVVGSNPPPAIAGLDLPGVVVHGFVADLEGFLDARLATIAPLQYGAGIKGKIGSSLAAGVPCISTPVGVEGMGLRIGDEVLVADTPQGFAAAVSGLIRDEPVWTRLSAAGLDFVERNYSPAVTRTRLLRLLAKVNAVPFSGHCPLSGRTETRRFADADLPDSLAAGAHAPWSSERVLAQALLDRLGRGVVGRGVSSLNRLEPGPDTPRVALHGRLPTLEAALLAKDLIADPDSAAIHAARLTLDETAADSLSAILQAADTTAATDLLIACTAPGPVPAETLAPRITQILKTGTWTPRTTRTPTPETAMTHVAIIEAKRTELSVPGSEQEVGAVQIAKLDRGQRDRVASEIVDHHVRALL